MAALPAAWPHDDALPWLSVEQVELATAELGDVWNSRRVHEACWYRPPTELEAAYHSREAVFPAA